MVKLNPNFFRSRGIKISHRPTRKENDAVFGCGNLGCENAIKSVQVKKQIGEGAGVLVLLHPDTNFLLKGVKQASKFISKDRICPIQINQLRGNGNGKSPKECVKNFALWCKEIDRQVPTIIAQAGRAGSWCAEYHTGSGGSYPAMMYAMRKVENIFYKKLIVVGEATDTASKKNMPELLAGLSKLDSSYKVIFAHNKEHPPFMQLVDLSNMGVVGAVTLGTAKKDATDFLGEENGLDKFSELQIGFGAIPYDGWIFKKQTDERTLSTCVNLFQSLKMQKNDTAIVLGEVLESILDTANAQANGIQKPEAYLKNVGVKMEPWNLILGRLRAFVPAQVPTPNFDKLDELAGF